MELDRLDIDKADECIGIDGSNVVEDVCIPRVIMNIILIS